MKPFVSVIIPALNEERNISKCLRSIQDLNYPKDKYEVILVDNGSTDKTLEIAKKFNIKILSVPEATIPKLRNFGIKHAKGKIIASTDSDCIVDRNWLKNALPYFKNSRIGAVGYRYDAPEEGTLVEKIWAGVEKSRNKTETDVIPTGNLFFRKAVWNEIGRFDESLTTGSDPEFCYRVIKAGYKIISDPKIRISHLGFPKTLIQFVKKQYWHGKKTLDIALKHGFKIRQFKIMIFSVFSLIFLTGFLISIPILILYNTYIPFLFFLILLFLVPILLSFRTIFKTQKIMSFPILIILYLLYGITRGVVIFLICFKKCRIY